MRAPAASGDDNAGTCVAPRVAAGSLPARQPFAGCQALVPGPAIATTVTDAFGNALVPFPLPANPALHGLALYGQGVALDPAGALFGAAAMTAGLRVVLSH